MLFTISLRWLWHRPARAIMVGVFGGPLTYFFASKLGAIQFVSFSARDLIIMAVFWAGAILTMVRLTWIIFENNKKPTIRP